MIRAKRDAFRFLFGLALGVLIVLPVNAQDLSTTDEKGKAAAAKVTEMKSELEFPGEKLDPASGNDAGNEIIAACGKALNAFDFLKNLNVQVEHKHYRKEGKLHFKELFECFFDLSDKTLPKVRLDFLNYVESDKRLDSFVDYREIFGEDGAFKYKDNKVIRLPDAIKEARIRTLRTYLMIFGPLCFQLDWEKAKYEGKCSWSEMIDNEEVTHNCYKIVALFDDARINIREDKVAFYFDTETKNLVRMLFHPATSNTNRLKITDYRSRIEMETIHLPSNIFVNDYWGGMLQATHKYSLEAYSPNTDLSGITFGMTNQQPKPRKDSK